MEHPELSGMGTTVTMALHLGAQLCVVHVGDSRAYVYRDGELHQLTEDHTVTAEMVRSGTLRPDEVAGHRLRHVITNEAIAATLGAEPLPEVAAKKLLAQANDAGGRDNITLVIVRFDQDDSEAGSQ